MLKVNIVSKVDIEPISQEFMEELLRKAIAEQNPEVYVNSFTFAQRRDPARIEVTVDAQIGAPALANVKTEKVTTVTEEVTADPVVEEEQAELDLAELMDGDESNSAPTVAGLFS